MKQRAGRRSRPAHAMPRESTLDGRDGTTVPQKFAPSSRTSRNCLHPGDSGARSSALCARRVQQSSRFLFSGRYARQHGRDCSHSPATRSRDVEAARDAQRRKSDQASAGSRSRPDTQGRHRLPPRQVDTTRARKAALAADRGAPAQGPGAPGAKPRAVGAGRPIGALALGCIARRRRRPRRAWACPAWSAARWDPPGSNTTSRSSRSGGN